MLFLTVAKGIEIPGNSVGAAGLVLSETLDLLHTVQMSDHKNQSLNLKDNTVTGNL